MTTHPPEPPAPWPSSPDERPASPAQRPGPPEEWRGPFQRHPANMPADDPPDSGYEHAPGRPPGAGYGPDDYAGYPAAPGDQDLPGYPRDGYERDGYPATPDYPPGAGYPPTPDYPAMPDYPPTPGFPPTPDYPATPDYPRADGYLTAPGHPDATYRPGGHLAADYPGGGHPGGGSQVAEFPAGGWVPEGAPVTHEEYVHPGDGPARAVDTPRARAGPAPAGASADAAPAAGPEGTQWAMLAYLTVPFFGFLVPLAVYLMSRRRSRWLRAHAAQAINVWLTVILYGLSALIIGALLLLDSPRVALAVVVPLVIALWLTTLVFLVRAAARASRGETYTFPRWLCAPMVR